MDDDLSVAPKVSVIIPARNEGKRIVRVIEEVKKVSPSIEILVVSNGQQMELQSLRFIQVLV